MPFKSLGLLIPSVRRVYAHRNALLMRVTELEHALRKDSARNEERELETCTGLAPRCLFVVGYARSNTTITSQVLNTARNALLLGEANFYQRNDSTRWSDWYNAMHMSYHNQIAKYAHAPDFIPANNHTWWEWLQAASKYYETLGDKMAFSSYHLTQPGPDAIRRFFEARFFDAKYIFLLRNPVATLLSTAKILDLSEDATIRRECDAWLRYVQLWADWIRVFPNTLTLVAEDFGPKTVATLQLFTGLQLEGAELLLEEGNRRRHQLPAHFSTLAALKHELTEIYDLAKAALEQDRKLWQVEQKRSAERNDNRGDSNGRVTLVPRPLGHAWVLAEDLRQKLACS